MDGTATYVPARSFGELNEENGDCAGSGAFFHQHRRLRDCASAARGYEGLTAKGFEAEKGRPGAGPFCFSGDCVTQDPAMASRAAPARFTMEQRRALRFRRGLHASRRRH
jgi:hypothetical protein